MSAPEAWPTSTTVSLHEVSAALRRRWRVVASGAAAGALAGLALVSLGTATYEGRSVVAVTAVNDNPLVASGQRAVSVETESQVVTSTSVAGQAATALEWRGTTAELLAHVRVSSPRDSQILEIAFTASNPERAAEGADAFADAYLSYRSAVAQSRIDDLVGRLNAQITALGGNEGGDPTVAALVQQLRQQVTQLQTTVISAGQLISRAEPPRDASGPGTPVLLAMGLAVGTVAGLCAALLRAQRDPRVHDAQAVEERLGVPVVAEVPRDGDQDAYRALAAKLTAPDGRLAARAVLLVSADAGERPHSSPRDLARALARSGFSTLLVQVRQPLRPGDGSAAAPAQEVLSRLRSADLGPERDLSASDPVPAHLTTGVDVVVIDGVNVALPSTALLLARAAERTVAVAQRGRTRPADLQALARSLAEVGTDVAAVVLLDAPARRSRPAATPASAAITVPPPAPPQPRAVAAAIPVENRSR